MLETFLSKLEPMHAAKARTALEMIVKFNGGDLMRRHVIVETRVAEGSRVTTRKSGERVLMRPDGTWLDTQNITKTGLDYAEFLEANLTT